MSETNPAGRSETGPEEDPFAFFTLWFEEAEASEALAEAMVLATASREGRPSARMVLLKGVDPRGAEGRPSRDAVASTIASARMVLLKGVDPRGAEGRGFVFYTNRDSRKGRELAENPEAALLFYWKRRNRQVRIEGKVAEVAPEEADAYFATRPRLSRLGAWASDQSRPLPARTLLEARLAEAEARFPGEAIPRPPYWTGFRLVPERFEFWEERPFRLHERRLFARAGAGWTVTLLYP